MKLLENFTYLIAEASKKDILINKIGLSPESAEYIDRRFKGLSVWITNKLLELIDKTFSKNDLKLNKKEILSNLESSMARNQFNQSLTSISDYIRVGLNGNIDSIKDLKYSEIYMKSKEWHDSLEIGSGDINYVEKNPIVVDFRDENGNGFYWVNLQTNDSKIECERMGHCGRSSYGNLYSLRENKQLPGGKFTLNKSHLTAAIGGDGILYQLKGPKNSKPKDEFHKYILPLFYVKDDDDEYLIEGFGSEYASQQDFKLSDLPNEVIVNLYENRPELFESRSLKKKLAELGLIEPEPFNTHFILTIKPSDVEDYVRGGWNVRKYTNKQGNTRSVDIFETILSGDVWDLWDNYDADWSHALDYYIDDKNEKRLWNIVNKIAQEKNIDLEGMPLDDAINEVDENYDIRNALSSSINSAESDSYVNYLHDELKSVLEEYGKVIQMNDEGVKIEIDFDNFKDNISEEQLDEYIENFGDDARGIFREMVWNDEIEKPKILLDDRWYPDVDKNNFNEILSDRLYEIE